MRSSVFRTWVPAFTETVCVSRSVTACIGPNAIGWAAVRHRPGAADILAATCRKVSAHSIRFRRGGGFHVVRPLIRQAITHDAGDEIGSRRELFEGFIEFVLNKVDFLRLELALQRGWRA